MTWYRRSEAGWLLRIHVQPGAKSSGVAGLHGDALKIRLAAPAIDGKANAALVGFVAARLGVTRQAVSLLKGGSSRGKLLLVADLRVQPDQLLCNE